MLEKKEEQNDRTDSWSPLGHRTRRWCSGSCPGTQGILKVRASGETVNAAGREPVGSKIPWEFESPLAYS